MANKKSNAKKSKPQKSSGQKGGAADFSERSSSQPVGKSKKKNKMP